MRTQLLALLLFLLVTAPIGCQAREPVPVAAGWVSVRGETGREIMGFALRQTPYTPEIEPAVSEHLNRNEPDRQGRSLRRYGFYGWIEQDKARVVVVTETQSPKGENARQVVARYALNASTKPQPVTPLHDFGIRLTLHLLPSR